MALSANNMRMGPYDGTEANDIATMGGTVEILNEYLPSGANACVGAAETNDKSGIIFANWNENGDHSFYFLEYGETPVITPIPVPNLNFLQDHYIDLPDYQEDYNVSIQEIDGQLFWCDGPNQMPKKINWQRTYTSTLEQSWETSRVTRQPAYPLRVVFTDTATEPSALGDNFFDNTSVPTVGYQWGYTYVRDDNEESKGGPITQMLWSNGLRLYIPDSEVENYLLIDSSTVNNLTKQINFYFRIGNNGPWLFYETIDNVIENYVDEGGTMRIYLAVEDLNFVQGNAALNDPFAQVFDAVPLYVRDNKLVKNRLFDANFIEDYNPVTGFDWTITFEKIFETATIESQTPEYRCLHPTDTYLVSATPIDFAGRRTGVASIQTVKVPVPDYKRLGIDNVFDGGTWSFNTQVNEFFTLSNIGRDGEAYNMAIQLQCDLPDWCENVQISISRNQTTSSFVRTNAFMWLWGEKDGLDYVTFAKVQDVGPPARYVNPSGGVVYKGICLELGSGEPFNFDVNEEQYVRIIGTVYDPLIFTTWFKTINYDDSDEWGVDTFPYGYKIAKQEGSRIFIELNSAQIAQFKKTFWYIEDSPSEDGMASLNKSYIIDIFSVAQAPEKTYYQVYNTILTAAEVEAGSTTVFYYGDCYLKNTRKNFNVGGVYNLISENGNVLDQNSFVYPSFDWKQLQICTSLQASFNTNWDSDFGQPNFKNINQKQTTRQGDFQWSGAYLPGTSINGLSNVNPLDRQPMPLELGFINCLMTAVSAQSASTVLLAYCENGVQSNYIGVAQTVDVSGTVVWSATTKIVGQSQPLRGPYGSNRVKQVVSTQNSEVFSYCPAFKDFIQYALDGLNRLGQQNLFQNAVKLIAFPGRGCIGFDPSIQEVVFGDYNGQGLAYNSLYKSFQGNRYYNQTDRFCFVQDTLFSWKDGICYVHPPRNSDRAFIYGERPDSSFTVVSNVQPDKMKQWEQIVLDGDLFNVIEIYNENGQTTIPTGRFQQRKYNVWKAAILRNENSLGGANNGYMMESRILQTRIADNGDSIKKLNFVELNGSISIAQ